MSEIIVPVLWFLALGGVLGVALSLASKFLAVKEDPRVEALTELLPGANCGGCGKAGCAALAEAIANGEAKPTDCAVADKESIVKMSELMGIELASQVRLRAQVMCSGTYDLAKKKYHYEGVHDCIAASKLAGGDKLCPNGCIGLGSCVEACKFDAIRIVNGCAAVDYRLCTACGACASTCPKGLIRMIPFDAEYWVGCTCTESGVITRKACDVGCIGCKICEKNCPTGAIKVENGLARISYDACTNCGKCAEVCPRHIIWSAHGKTPSAKKEESEEISK